MTQLKAKQLFNISKLRAKPFKEANMDEGKNREIWNKIIIKAWKNKAFKQELLKNPSKILDEHGLRVPEGIKVDVVEDTQEHVYLHLPYAPSDVEKLSTSELEAMSGGELGTGNSKYDLLPCNC